MLVQLEVRLFVGCRQAQPNTTNHLSSIFAQDVKKIVDHLRVGAVGFTQGESAAGAQRVVDADSDEEATRYSHLAGLASSPSTT